MSAHLAGPPPPTSQPLFEHGLNIDLTSTFDSSRNTMESHSVGVSAIPDQLTHARESVIRQPAVQHQARSSPDPDLLSPVNLVAPGPANQSVTPRVDVPLPPLNASTSQSAAPGSPPSVDLAIGIAERRSRSPVIRPQSEHPQTPEYRFPPNSHRSRSSLRRPTLSPVIPYSYSIGGSYLDTGAYSPPVSSTIPIPIPIPIFV